MINKKILRRTQIATGIMIGLHVCTGMAASVPEPTAPSEVNQGFEAFVAHDPTNLVTSDNPQAGLPGYFGFNADPAGGDPTGGDLDCGPGIYVDPDPSGGGPPVGDPFDATLVGLEVVQVVQDWQNRAPLVADKETIVRAHFESAISTNRNFDLRLYGCEANGDPLPGVYVQNGKGGAGQTLSLPSSALPAVREELEKNIYFKVPSSWLTQGTKRFSVHWPENAEVQCGEIAGPDAFDCEVAVNFEQSPTLSMELIPVHLPAIIPSKSWSGTTCSSISKRYPVSAANLSCDQSDTPIWLESNDALSEERLIDAVVLRKLLDQGCTSTPCNKFYMAVSPEPLGGFAGNADFPGQLSQTIWAVEPQIDAAAPAHELGHSLGFHHTTNATRADGYKIGTCAEVALGSASYPLITGLTDPFFPYYTAAVIDPPPLLVPVVTSSSFANEGAFAFDSETDKILPATSTAMMSYCNTETQFPAISTYKALLSAIPFSAVAASDDTFDGSLVEAVANENPYYIVFGIADEISNSVEVDQVLNIVPGSVPETPDPNEWTLLVHRTGLADTEVSASAVPSVNVPNELKLTGSLPYDPDIIGFSFARSDAVEATVMQSENAPEVTITAPTGGEVFIGTPLVLDWDAMDLDGDDLEFSIEYSLDDGNTWTLIAFGWSNPPFTVDPELLPPSRLAQFRVTASDGFNDGFDTLDTSVIILKNKVFENGFE